MEYRNFKYVLYYILSVYYILIVYVVQNILISNTYEQQIFFMMMGYRYLEHDA